MLAGDADRERAVEVLRDAFAEGRLTGEEHEERVGRAYLARTYGELAALTADVPRPVRPPRRPPPPPRTNGTAVAALVCGVAGAVTFGVTSFVAVGLGHSARRQIRRTGERGEGQATAGLVLGYLGVAVWALVIAAAVALFRGL